MTLGVQKEILISLSFSESIIDDLSQGNILGAIRTGGTLRNTLRNVDTSQLISTDLATEAVSQGANFLSNIGSSNRPFGFPSTESNNVSSGFQENFHTNSPARANVNTFATLSESLGSTQRQFALNSNLLNTSVTTKLTSIQHATQQGIAVLEQAELGTSLQPTLDNLQQNTESTASNQATRVVFDPKPGVSGDVISNGQQVGGR